MAKETKRRGQGFLFLFNITLILSLTVCTPLRKARWLKGIKNEGLPLIVIPGEQQENRHLEVENHRFRDRPVQNRVGLLSRQKRLSVQFYFWDKFEKFKKFRSYRYGYPQGANILNIVPGYPGSINGKNAWEYFSDVATKHSKFSRFWKDIRWQLEIYNFPFTEGVVNSETMVIAYLFINVI